MATTIEVLEYRVTKIEDNLKHMEKEIIKGNAVSEEILEIVKLGRFTGKILQWIAGMGAAIGTMAIAWHWYK